MTAEIKLWHMSYTHAGAIFAARLWGTAEEVESHAERLGWRVDGELQRIVCEVSPEVLYDSEALQ